MAVNEIALFFAALAITLSSNHLNKGDREIIESGELVLDKLSDAEFVRKIEVMTGKNLRDQITLEKANDIREEVELLKMGNSRN